MNCSLGLLEGRAKKLLDIALKPLEKRNEQMGKVLLLAELVVVVQELEHLQDVLHNDQRVATLLALQKELFN
jgi:hypothetical protein